MKINGHANIFDINGEKVFSPEQATNDDGSPKFKDSGDPVIKHVPFLLYRAIRLALVSQLPDDEKEEATKKFDRWQLAQKVVDGEFELTVEEAGLIKSRASKALTLTAYAAIHGAIEKG